MPSTFVCASALLAVLALLASPKLGQAQEKYALTRPAEPTEEVRQEAFELYKKGLSTAADESRWADALAMFEEVYRKSGSRAALYNAAITLRSLGRHRDARDAFTQFIELHTEAPAAEVEEATRMRNEAAQRVSLLAVEDLPVAESLTLRLDGTKLSIDDERPLLLEADPGRHVLRVELPKFDPFLWEGALGDGDRRTIRIRLVERKEPSRSVAKSPLFWILTAVVLGGIATAGYFLFRKDGVQPMSDLVVEL